MTDAFFIKLKVAAIAGIFVASPVIFYQAWRFVSPGLYSREKRVAVPFSMAATFFFVVGAGFCYELVFPVAFNMSAELFAGVLAKVKAAPCLAPNTGPPPALPFQ